MEILLTNCWKILPLSLISSTFNDDYLVDLRGCHFYKALKFVHVVYLMQDIGIKLI